jgi:caffeoyl-CoA O-methyltransferase
MKAKLLSVVLIFVTAGSLTFLFSPDILSQESLKNKNIDESVKTFLEKRKGTRSSISAPEQDVKMLYDIIIKNNYKSALEIGTNVGYSGVWMAWALSKTGGKLTTIEIDENNYKQALANFKEAGVADYVDARLADAHTLVKELKGPFDFVFSDADKDWYKNYFIDVYPKLAKGGCYTTHNVYDPGRGRRFWSFDTSEYFNYVKNIKDMETSVYSGGSGLMISYKK